MSIVFYSDALQVAENRPRSTGPASCRNIIPAPLLRRLLLIRSDWSGRRLPERLMLASRKRHDVHFSMYIKDKVLNYASVEFGYIMIYIYIYILYMINECGRYFTDHSFTSAQQFTDTIPVGFAWFFWIEAPSSRANTHHGFPLPTD